MENTVNDRVNKLIKYYGVSVLAYSKMIGIPQKTLNNQVNGLNEVGTGTLLAILGYDKDISSEWLMRGTGNMLLSENTKKDALTSSYDLDKDEEIKRLKEENRLLDKEVSFLNGQVSILIQQSSKKEDREGKSA